MRRMRLGVCVLVIGSLALAAGCKPNLRLSGPVAAQRIGATNNVGVHVVVENDSRRDVKHPFRVGFRRFHPAGPWKFVSFSHGLKRQQKRPIKQLVDAAVGTDLQVRVDFDDNIPESDENDNFKQRPAP